MPFSGMSGQDLRWLAGRVQLAYFPAGITIVDPANGPAQHLHIIQRGHVRSHNPAARGDDEVLGAGECFPVAALSADATGTRQFIATEDVFCYQLARADFDELRRESPPFARFCTEALAAIVHQSLGQLRLHFSQRAAEQQTLLEPVGGLVRREPVFCQAETPLRAALEAMRREQVGTIAVVDADGQPAGIFTLTDLLERVVLADCDLAAPVATVMTPNPRRLDELATAQEALSVMAQQGYHQLMITREGRLVGVVSERDLFALQRVSMRSVLQAIRLAGDLAGLGRIRRDIDALTDALLAQGVAAEPLTHAITALNGMLAQRAFELLQPGFGLEGLDWCWLAVGSEGRREQTVATDQDNAILFDCAPHDAESARGRLLAFGRAANEALAGLGFPLCPGDIMAGNPDCCLTAAEWRTRFAAWIREPTPAALLRANVFFDFRPLAGTAELAGALRGWLGDVTPANRLFLRMLVANALQAEPPLGVIRTFRTDDGPLAGTLDLKTHGTRIFVDAARAFALAFGIAETNTAQRLRLAGQRLNLPEREVTAAVDAFQFLQLLRLKAQRGGVDAGPVAHERRNRLDPHDLNALDQRMLKESFRQARALQRRLEQSIGQ